VGALVACALVAPSIAGADGRPVGPGAPVVTRRLDNGLTVIVQEDHRVPLVALALFYQAGERADPDGLPGVAQLTTELMVRKTKYTPEGAYARLMARAGALWKYETRKDDSIFEVQLPSNQFALPLWLWSDQMGFFEEALDPATFEAQRTTLEVKRRNTFETEPLGHLEAFADEEMFPAGHPYRNAVMESPDQVHRITREDVIAYHHAWLTPDHATLTIVGDVAPPDVLAQVERYFGPHKPSTTGPRAENVPSFQLPGQIEVDVAAKVPNPRVLIRWPSPRFMTTDDASLDILTKLLTGDHTAWLYWRLVDKEKVARRVWLRQRSNDLVSQLELTIEGAPGQTPAQLLAAFDAAIVDLSPRVPSADELRMAVYENLVNRFDETDDIKSRAWHFGRYTELVGTPGYWEHDMQRYQEDGSSIAGAIAKWMPSDRRVVLLVKPDPSAPPGGTRTGRRLIPSGAP
jgi:zinc protease